jgi:hypothetical protein
MKTIRHTTMLAAWALCLGALAGPALAGDDDDECQVPRAQWQSRDAVRQHAASQGWRLHRIEVDDGCYEVRGRDAEGRGFKAKLDPKTLEVVKMKWRDRDRDQRRARDRDRLGVSGSDPTEAAGPATAPARPHGPVLTPGTRPRAQIE